jgi:hypothetical protein
MGFASNAWQFQPYGGSWGTAGGITMDTTALYRDTSSWYHHVIIWDTSQAVQANRVRMYVNGEQITSFSAEGVTGQLTLNESLSYINQSGVIQAFGGLSGKGHGTEGADLQMAEIVFCDGQSYGPDSFGETKNGVWIPKDPSGLTFGNNGYWLKFESSSDLGNDSSGNNNDFTAANLSTHDQMLDSPTFSATDGNGGNFCNIGGLEKNTGGFTFSEGNLKYAVSTNNRGFIFSQGVPESGKYYWEVRVTQFGGTQDHVFIGVCEPDKMRGNLTGSRGGADVSGAGGYTVDNYHGAAVLDGTTQSADAIGTARSVPQTFGFAIDRDNNTFKWTYDGSSYSSTYTIPSSGVLAPYIGSGGGSNTASGVFNFGADSTFAGLVTAGGNADENGYGNFSLAVPSGYLALCAANLPTAAAVDPAQTDDAYPSKVFSAITYTGTGSEKAVAVGWQPDLTWVKERGGVNDHKLTDSVRGATKALESNTDAAETTDAQGVKAFTGTGFTLGTDAVYNNNTDTYISWNWKEGADYGLDIVAYSGSLTGTGVVNISHSLGAIPECIWHMSRSALGGAIRHQSLTSANYMMTNAGSSGSGTGWGNSAQVDKSGNGNMTALGTSSTFTTNYTGILNQNGDDAVAYVWRGIEGFSKFGGYTGNGNADGPFVYTGFSPAYVIIKRRDGVESFFAMDNKRIGFNVVEDIQQLNGSGADDTTNYDALDFLSNGFKLRLSDAGFNGSEQYTYMAWAENPFQYATAR